MSATQTVASPLTWNRCRYLAEAVRERNPEAVYVWGVPRGGFCPAALTGLKMFSPPWAKVTPKILAGECDHDELLIIDDLVDSGRTAEKYLSEGLKFDALFRKESSPPGIAPNAEIAKGWVTFPWEDGESGPEDAVVRLLQWIGEDPTREGLIDTPKRVTRAFLEMTEGLRIDPRSVLGTVFNETSDEMVVVRGIRFASLCEHHLLPFIGTATVGYVPNGRVIGLSKIPRLVEAYARRPQVQERMTNQIASTMIEVLQPKGVGVVLKAHHSCMGCRGVRQPDAEMVTSSMLGCLRSDPASRAELLGLM